MDVWLNEHMEALGTAIGNQRHEWAQDRRLGDYSITRQSRLIHQQGGRGEVAVCVGFGLDPVAELSPPMKRPFSEPDVTTLGCEVRATQWTTGCLPLHPAKQHPLDPPEDLDERPAVLVICAGNGLYRIVGWVWGYEGKRARYWRDGRHGWRHPAFAVPQSKLRDPSTLPGAVMQPSLWDSRAAHP